MNILVNRYKVNYFHCIIIQEIIILNYVLMVKYLELNDEHKKNQRKFNS